MRWACPSSAAAKTSPTPGFDSRTAASRTLLRAGSIRFRVANRLQFVAGEASGDEHGSALMRALRELAPDCEFFGRGGPQMKAIAGDAFMDWIDAAAVVGLWEVLKRYGYFRKQ